MDFLTQYLLWRLYFIDMNFVWFSKKFCLYINFSIFKQFLSTKCHSIVISLIFLFLPYHQNIVATWHPINLAPSNSKTEVILKKMAVKMIEYTNFKYVQGPYILFARLLVLAAVPAAFDEGLNVLAFMQNFAPNINKHLSNLWDQRIPLLQHYLEQTKVKQRVLIEMEMKAPVFFLICQ